MTVIVLRENGHLFVRPFLPSLPPPPIRSLPSTPHHRRIASLPRPSVRRATQSSVRPPGGRNAPLSPAKLRNEVDWMGRARGRVSLLSRSTSKMALSPPLTNSTGTSAGHHYPFGKVLNKSRVSRRSNLLCLSYHCLPCLQIMGTRVGGAAARRRRHRQASVFNLERSGSTAAARAPCIYNFIPWSTASYVLSAYGGGGPKPFAAAAKP